MEEQKPPEAAAVTQEFSGRVQNPELIFGIIGPIGVNIDSVVAELVEALKGVNYSSVEIHLTDHM